MRARLLIPLLVAALASPAAAQPAFDLPITVSKPAGQGPFPAVVILHDCSGLGPRSSGSPYRWQTRLARAGYVTISPDSFSTRGHPDGVCTNAGARNVGYADRGRDAYAALAYAQALPFVDPKRVAVMGGSHGGSSTLAAIVQRPRVPALKAPGFVGAVALYPGCGINFVDWRVTRDRQQPEKIVAYAGVFRPRAPLLILIGELDDWTPAEPCRRLAEAAKADGQPVEIVIYPKAHHSFDSATPVLFRTERRNMNAPGGHGATTGGDIEAWSDAVRRTLAFLKERMDAVK